VLRLIRWAATGLVVLAAFAWGIVWMAQGDPGGEAANLVRLAANRFGDHAPMAELGVGGPFSLVDTNGKPATDQTYRGKWMLIYFGYAYCPDICPTILQTISSALDQLGNKAVQVAPLFITVDPARDTPAAIGQYVALFDPRLIGLTGTSAQINAAQAAYHVYSHKVVSKGDGGYMIDHSSYVYLMGPDGKLKTVFQADTSEADMVDALNSAISGRQ
jgi:cytochrome oxidase Cu insertion factor (SCO1/SenC/PrrC family)